MQGSFKANVISQMYTLYRFKEIVWLDKLGGFSALNYEILADKTPFVLKKYRSSNTGDIEQIEAISKFLYEQKLPVLPPRKTTQNKRHFVIDGNIFALFPKTDGVVLHEPSFSEPVLVKTASLLVKLHRLDPFHLNLPPAKNILPIEEIRKNAEQVIRMIQEKPLGISVDNLTKTLIEEKLRTLTELIPHVSYTTHLKGQYFVHGDFHNENLLFDKNHKNIVRLLDFEETHLGYRIEDVMHFIFLACCNSGYKKANMRKAQFFIKSYHSLFPISAEEISFGVYYQLFKEFSSFFLEQALYVKQDLFLIKLIERDLKKLTYFKLHTQAFIKTLCL